MTVAFVPDLARRVLLLTRRLGPNLRMVADVPDDGLRESAALGASLLIAGAVLEARPHQQSGASRIDRQRLVSSKAEV